MATVKEIKDVVHNLWKSMKLHEAKKDWCNEKFPGRWHLYNGTDFVFDNEEDEIWFLLTWS